MAMGWEGIHHSRWDWKYTSQPMRHANHRQIHLPAVASSAVPRAPTAR